MDLLPLAVAFRALKQKLEMRARLHYFLYYIFLTLHKLSWHVLTSIQHCMS